MISLLPSSVSTSALLGGVVPIPNETYVAFDSLDGGVYGIDGVCDIEAMYSGFSSQINSAWSVSTLSGLQTAITGYNPIDAAAASYAANCNYYRFVYSNADSVVPAASHALAMVSILSGSVTEASTIEKTNGHLDSNHFDPTDFISFVNRAIT